MTLIKKERAIILPGGEAILRHPRSAAQFTRTESVSSKRFCWRRVVAFVIMLCFATVYGHTQATNGTINGTLTDPNASVISGAKVTLVNIGTADTRTATTNDSGFYQFNNLPPGQYRITAEQQGFKQLVRGPIELQVDSTLQINLSLTLGTASEVVTVVSSTPLIQAETASLGTVIDQRETNEIPLNGRNAMNLVALAPSVVPQGQSQQNPNGTNPFAWGNYQIGGGIANQSVTYLDGAPVNTEYNNITSIVPTQDSLQEFKVEPITSHRTMADSPAAQFNSEPSPEQITFTAPRTSICATRSSTPIPISAIRPICQTLPLRRINTASILEARSTSRMSTTATTRPSSL